LTCLLQTESFVLHTFQACKRASFLTKSKVNYYG
jgi:hypothetical protein